MPEEIRDILGVLAPPFVGSKFTRPEPAMPGQLPPEHVILAQHLHQKYGASPDLAQRWAGNIIQYGPHGPDWKLYQDAQAAHQPPQPTPTLYNYQPGEFTRQDRAAEQARQAMDAWQEQAQQAHESWSTEPPLKRGEGLTAADVAQNAKNREQMLARRGVTHPSAVEYHDHLLSLKDD